MRVLWLVLVAAAVAPFAAHAATIWISGAHGTDVAGCGTVSAPTPPSSPPLCATLQFAFVSGGDGASGAHDGDTLAVATDSVYRDCTRASGRYDGTASMVYTAARSVALAAWQPTPNAPARVTVDCGGSGRFWASDNAAAVSLSGFVVRNGMAPFAGAVLVRHATWYGGQSVAGANATCNTRVSVSNCVFENNRDAALSVTPPPNPNLPVGSSGAVAVVYVDSGRGFDAAVSDAPYSVLNNSVTFADCAWTNNTQWVADADGTTPTASQAGSAGALAVVLLAVGDPSARPFWSGAHNALNAITLVRCTFTANTAAWSSVALSGAVAIVGITQATGLPVAAATTSVGARAKSASSDADTALGFAHDVPASWLLLRGVNVNNTVSVVDSTFVANAIPGNPLWLTNVDEALTLLHPVALTAGLASVWTLIAPDTFDHVCDRINAANTHTWHGVTFQANTLPATQYPLTPGGAPFYYGCTHYAAAAAQVAYDVYTVEWRATCDVMNSHNALDFRALTVTDNSGAAADPTAGWQLALASVTLGVGVSFSFINSDAMAQAADTGAGGGGGLGFVVARSNLTSGYNALHVRDALFARNSGATGAAVPRMTPDGLEIPGAGAAAFGLVFSDGAQYADVAFTNCTFEDNWGGPEGGAGGLDLLWSNVNGEAVCTGNALALDGVRAVRNHATSPLSPWLRDSQTAAAGGVSLRFMGCPLQDMTVSVSNSEFGGNFGGPGYGAVTGGGLVLCVRATDSAPASFVDHLLVTIADSLFHGNGFDPNTDMPDVSWYASRMARGGAIGSLLAAYSLTRSLLALVNVTVRDNVGDSNSAAISPGVAAMHALSSVDAFAWAFTNCSFAHNAVGFDTISAVSTTATAGGLAIGYTTGSDNLPIVTGSGYSHTIQSCVFANNSAGSADPTVSFSAVAAASAGAVAIGFYSLPQNYPFVLHTLRVDDTQFLGNSNLDPGYAVGGALAVAYDTLYGQGNDRNTHSISRSVFRGNTGAVGAVAILCVGASENHITDVEFVSNYAPCDLCSGGALSLSGAMTYVTRARFAGNTAAYSAGAVSVQSSASANFTDSVFDHNIAHAGATELEVRATGVVHLRNCTMLLVGATSASGEVTSINALSTHLTSSDQTVLQCPAGSVLFNSPFLFGCSMCPPQQYSVVPGTWLDPPNAHSARSECQACPLGGTNCSGADVYAVPGYWAQYRAADGAIEMTACPTEYCCAGADDVLPDGTHACRWNTTCDGTHRAGRLCGRCADGYSETFGSATCAPTASCDGARWFVPVSALLGGALFAFFFVSDRRSDGLFAIVSFFFQTVGLAFVQTSSTRLFGNAVTQLFDFRVTSAGSGVCVFPGLDGVGLQATYGLAPLVCLLAPALLVWVVYVARAPRAPRGSRCANACCTQPNAPSGLLNDDYLDSPLDLPMRNPDAAAVTVVDSKHSGGHDNQTALLADRPVESSDGDGGVFGGAAGGSSTPFMPADRFAAALANIALFTYSAVLKAVFVLLHCVPISGADGAFLFDFAEVQCYQSWQYVLFAVLGLLVLFPLVLVWWTVARSRQRATNAWGGGLSAATLARVDILCSPYRSAYPYWSAVLLLQRLLLIALYTFVTSPLTRVLLLLVVSLALLLCQVTLRPFRLASMNAFHTLSLTLLVTVAALNLTPAVLLSGAYPPTASLQSAINALSIVQALVLAVPLVVGAALFVHTKVVPRARTLCCPSKSLGRTTARERQ